MKSLELDSKFTFARSCRREEAESPPNRPISASSPRQLRIKSPLLLLPALALGLLASSASAQTRPDLTNAVQRYNYAFGLDIVSTFKQQDVDIDLKAFLAGMQDAMAGKPALSTNEQQAALKELQEEFMTKAEAAW